MAQVTWRGTSLRNLIIGIVAIFSGFVIILILYAQASVVNLATGSVTLSNVGLFYGAIFLAMVCVLLGGFEIGTYVEMELSKRNKSLSA